MTTSSLRNSFPVRISRRVYENRGKVCPSCGESNPLLIVEDGRCANCRVRHKQERHHILGKAFRRSKEDEAAVIPVSPNAHRLLSDLQAGHPLPPASDPASRPFLEAWLWELAASLTELWLVWTYLDERPDQRGDIPLVVLISLGLLLLMNLDRLDLSSLIERARMKFHDKRSSPVDKQA